MKFIICVLEAVKLVFSQIKNIFSELLSKSTWILIINAILAILFACLFLKDNALKFINLNQTSSLYYYLIIFCMIVLLYIIKLLSKKEKKKSETHKKVKKNRH